MRKLFSWRPSAAMIVAVVALVMALVGAGIAASALTNAGDTCNISKQTGGITAAQVDLPWPDCVL